VHSDTDARLIDLFLQYCERVIAMDEDTVHQLQRYGFAIPDNGWNFTLPQLHQFLLAEVRADNAPAYITFRQQLFQCPINTRLAKIRAEVVIAENTGKVDRSTYRLQRKN
jgi:hypothetical protein